MRETVVSVLGDQATELVPFKGRVIRAMRNAGGRSQQVRFEIQSVKARLDVSLGLPCTHHCVWALFGRGCSVQGGLSPRGPQLAAEQVTRSITAIDGKEITINSDPGLSGTKSLRFGYVRYNGVRIGIQDWDSGDPTKVILRQQPSASWLSQTVTLVPGCPKTIEACRGDWSNEDNIGNIGYSIPPYNPHYEDSE